MAKEKPSIVERMEQAREQYLLLDLQIGNLELEEKTAPPERLVRIWALIVLLRADQRSLLAKFGN